MQKVGCMRNCLKFISVGINVTCNIYPVLRCRKFILKCLSFIPISFIVFQDNTNTQNGNKNSWRWDETRVIVFFFAMENGVSFMPFSLPLKSPCSSKSIDISSRDKSNKYWRMYLCWWHNDYLPVVISSYYFSPDQWISLNCCTSCVDHILGLFVPHSSLVSVFFFPLLDLFDLFDWLFLCLIYFEQFSKHKHFAFFSPLWTCVQCFHCDFKKILVWRSFLGPLQRKITKR